MCEKVAHRHGRSMLEVMRDPWALTLFTFAMIADAERMEDLMDRVRAQRLAVQVAYAFHDTKQLRREGMQLERALRTPLSQQPKRLTDAEFKAQVNELLARRGMEPRYAN